jgi:hypothetical protein
MLSVALAAGEEMAALVEMAALLELALVAKVEMPTEKNAVPPLVQMSTRATQIQERVAMAVTDLAALAARAATAATAGRLMAAMELAAMVATASG